MIFLRSLLRPEGWGGVSDPLAFNQRRGKVKSDVSNHCHFRRGPPAQWPPPRAHSHFLVAVASVYWEQCLWLRRRPLLAVFALRCLLTVTIELAMFYCQFYLLRGCCFCTGRLRTSLSSSVRHFVGQLWAGFTLDFSMTNHISANSSRLVSFWRWRGATIWSGVTVKLMVCVD